MIDLDTRYRAVVHYTRFHRSLRSVAKVYNVSKSSLQRWAHSSPAFKKARPHHKLRTDIRDCITQTLALNPFATAGEIALRIEKACGVHRSRSTVSRFISSCNFTRKKAYRVCDRDHSASAVQSFCNNYQSATNIVCVDEAGFYVGDFHRRGYAPRGRRLNVPHAPAQLRRTKITLLLAIGASGVVGYEILDHNCKKHDFVRFMERLNLAPGTSVVMDNIAFHHSSPVHDILKSKGCRALYTLPYSPRCNAVEMVFGMLKVEYRKACLSQPKQLDVSKSVLKGLLSRPYDLSPFFRHTLAWVDHIGTVTESGAGLAGAMGYDA